MMRTSLFVAAAAALFAAACSEGVAPPPPPPPPMAAPPPPPAPAMMRSADAYAESAMAEPAPMPGSGDQTGAGAAAPLLAYSYSTSLELPAASLAPLHERHVQACLSAGPAVCQIVSSSVSNADSDRPSAWLQLRAQPGWLVTFRAEIASGAEAEGGRILSSDTQVEDLTARIVDAAARLEARTTLRDRLQALLETREGDLADLLAVERELANVQAELDAQASVLAALRQRVDTSTLSLSYTAARSPLQPDAYDPIGQALSEVGDVFADSVADILIFLAGLLPWLVIGGPVLALLAWIARRALKRRKPA